jgi:hypothetical protein
VTPEDDEPEYERTIFVTRKVLAQSRPIPDSVGHYLVVLQGFAPGRRLEIGSEFLTIGQGAKQTFVVDDPDVSRLHLRVSLVSGDVVAEDMDSTNGTFVDGQQIKGAGRCGMAASSEWAVRQSSTSGAADKM